MWQIFLSASQWSLSVPILDIDILGYCHSKSYISSFHMQEKEKMIPASYGKKPELASAWD